MELTEMALAEDAQFDALKAFADSGNKEVIGKLEDIVVNVAKTGQYIYPWQYLRHLYLHKLEAVTSDFLASNPPQNENATDDGLAKQLDDFRKTLIDMFSKFTCAPFTIQRISELLVNPRKHYKTSAKFFRGLEKNIQVVSTVDPVTPEENRLKRSLGCTVPESEQNGFSDVAALKPPEKRPARSGQFFTAQPPEKLRSISLPPVASVATSVLTSVTQNRQGETGGAVSSSTPGSSEDPAEQTMDPDDRASQEAGIGAALHPTIPSSAPRIASADVVDLASSEVLCSVEDDLRKDPDDRDQIVPNKDGMSSTSDDSTVPDVSLGKDPDSDGTELLSRDRHAEESEPCRRDGLPEVVMAARQLDEKGDKGLDEASTDGSDDSYAAVRSVEQ